MIAVVGIVAFVGCSTHYVPRGPGVYSTMEGGKIVYVRGGEKFEQGFLGSGLVKAVSPNPAASASAQKYRSQMKKGLLVMLGGLVCGTGALVLAVSGEDSNGDTDVDAGMLGVSLACYAAMYGGIFFFADAETYKLDAINIFNDGAAGGGQPQWNAPPGGRRGYSLQMRQ